MPGCFPLCWPPSALSRLCIWQMAAFTFPFLCLGQSGSSFFFCFPSFLSSLLWWGETCLPNVTGCPSSASHNHELDGSEPSKIKAGEWTCERQETSPHSPHHLGSRAAMHPQKCHLQGPVMVLRAEKQLLSCKGFHQPLLGCSTISSQLLEKLSSSKPLRFAVWLPSPPLPR